MGMHESQSLLWERMVALSPAFSKFLYPRLQAGELYPFPEPCFLKVPLSQAASR